jgi:hypothetical protein
VGLAKQGGREVKSRKQSHLWVPTFWTTGAFVRAVRRLHRENDFAAECPRSLNRKAPTTRKVGVFCPPPLGEGEEGPDNRLVISGTAEGFIGRRGSQVFRDQSFRDLSAEKLISDN